MTPVIASDVWQAFYKRVLAEWTDDSLRRSIWPMDFVWCVAAP